MTLQRCNPFVAAVYFLGVLLITMFVPHPIILAVSLLGAVSICAFLATARDLWRGLRLSLFLFCLITAVNPLFSHNGVTPLFYMNGNPVTLEAYLYGAGIGLMVVSVYLWCKALSLVFTADRAVYLFGKATPKTALVLSTALRYIPMLRRQADRIADAQKTIGCTASDGYWDRVKAILRMFSALIGWSLESAVETAKAMRAKGYGIGRRTAYSDLSFRLRDGLMTAVCLGLACAVPIAVLRHDLDFAYYPAVTRIEFSVWNTAAIAAFAVLAFLPAGAEIGERVKWNYYRSKI